MSELMIFNNHEFGEIRTIEEDGKVLFCGADVAKSLGYTNSRKALLDHCKGVTKRDTPTSGGVQSMSFIPEGDIYRLAAKSELPGAEKFESWIFDEVLPAIRKTGIYSVNQADSTKQTLAEAKLNNSRARMSSMWLKIASIVSIQDYKDICTSYASSALAGKEVLPLPECNEHLYTATEIGQMFGGIDKARIGKIANQNGLKSAEYGKTVWDKSPYSSKQVETFRYNLKAVERFSEILGGVSVVLVENTDYRRLHKKVELPK